MMLRNRYRFTSLIRDRHPEGPHSRIMPRVLRWPPGGGHFLMSKVPLYAGGVLGRGRVGPRQPRRSLRPRVVDTHPGVSNTHTGVSYTRADAKARVSNTHLGVSSTPLRLTGNLFLRRWCTWTRTCWSSRTSTLSSPAISPEV